MTKIAIPPPEQPFVADEKVNEPWRRHMDVTNHALNSASQLIKAVTFSTTTSTGVSCSIPAGWNSVRMDFNLAFTSTASSLCVSVSTDNGTSFISTGYKYLRWIVDDTTYFRGGSTSDAKFVLELGLSTGTATFGDAKIISVAGGNPRILSRVVSVGNETTELLAITDVGGRCAITDGRVNAVLFHTTGGNFASGSINFYGDR